jgi:hypothetical protein
VEDDATRFRGRDELREQVGTPAGFALVDLALGFTLVARQHGSVTVSPPVKSVTSQDGLA